ncbi:hypothetical protein GW746_01500 [Candidatus Saccharibacteria bacterium]|nr:hypothetical protein [Candidatus Saccharibacteria bacterium]NCS83072.1 hypothetical protein [Candidatus Saccharibacteria bacterium]
MFLVGLFSWWYGRGWIAQWGRVVDRWKRTIHLFSVGELAKTLFAPYRQISANIDDTSFAVAVRSFFDQLISRFIGAFIRTMTILVGLIVITGQIILETLIMIGWWIFPVLTIVGALLFALGWVPTWQ